MSSLFYVSAKDRWSVRFRDAEGVSRQRFFRSEGEARRFEKSLARDLAVEVALPMSVPERELWRRFVRVAESKGLALGTAVDLAEAALRAWSPPAPRTVAEAVRAFLDDVGGRNLRPKSAEQYRHVLTRVTRELDGLRLDQVSAERLVSWLCRTYAAESSRSTTGARIVSWLRWCAAPPRSWVPSSLAEGIRWPRQRADEKRIEFLTAAQVARLLQAADARLRPGLVLMAFAGVRPYEVSRLTWDEVNWSTRSILIPGSVAKTRVARRLHQLPDNLWAWLALTPKDARSGPLMPPPMTARRLLRQAKADAGLSRWPQDCLRHSFGTHGWWRGAEWVVATMGHVSGFAVLSRHYRGCVSPDEARAYFELMPPA
jgi:integrase